MSQSTEKDVSAELARQHGALWEKDIRKQNRELRRAEMAFVGKNWEAPNIPGSHRKREASKPDFSGHLPCGRHVTFEAKASLNTTSFGFGQITKGQRQYLNSAYECGCISFVFILDGLRRRWLIPWGEVLRVEAVEGRASFPYEEDSAFQKQRGETWLDCWQRLEKGGLT